MSITAEDLQFMADDMWKDALLPDLPGMYGFCAENSGDAPFPGDRLLDDPEVNNNGLQSTAAQEMSKNFESTLSDKPIKSIKDKGKGVLMASPSTDLYLSTPAQARPKKKSKLIMSMKGASQNGSYQGKGPHLSKPLKPTAAVLDKKKAASPIIATIASNPLGSMGGVIPASQKKPTKPQKRIAKRSFLDPPSSPAQRVAEKVIPIALPKPTLRETATAAVKKPARQTARKPVKPREVKPTVARPSVMRKGNVDNTRVPDSVAIEAENAEARCDFIVKKENTGELEDGWNGSAAVEKIVSDESIVKRLRPRGERAPIIISSDPASSCEEDDYSVSGSTMNTGTTSMTTPPEPMPASGYNDEITKAYAFADKETCAWAVDAKNITAEKKMPEEISKKQSSTNSCYAATKSTADKSDHIARQMMHLLESGANSSAAGKEAKSPHDLWLDSTDPYKETGQIMTYVCRTILRFLKSKETAIEDVADEYRQRGGAVLSRLGALHHSERCTLVHNYEQRRQRSQAAFETARRGVQLLEGKLQRVDLVPAIQIVLADDVASRMRALQKQMV
ncbi:hypothetical protein SEPCBS119000_005361 [Sporothrix epigloea]|uniref:Uncharacterized protein n=1 Tax=Sporothrix epigloea TaxID=1892477 RepID=A0ABP0DX62_9PEZI